MRRRSVIVAFVLVVSQLSMACGGFSPSGQGAAQPTQAPKAAETKPAAEAKPTEGAKPAAEAKPTEAAKPAAEAKPAATTAAPVPKPTEAAKPAAKGSGEVIVNAYSSEYED